MSVSRAKPTVASPWKTHLGWTGLTSSFATGRDIFLFNFGLLATSNCKFQVDPGVSFGVTSSMLVATASELTGANTLSH